MSEPVSRADVSEVAKPSGGRRRRLKRRILYGLAIGASATLLTALLRPTYPLRLAEWKSYDARMQLLAEPAQASPEIVFVEIDDNSMERYRDVLGRWPWPRDAYEGLLAYLSAAGARLVVFDILFPDPNLAYPVGDTAFAYALEDTGLGVLGFTLSPGLEEEAEAWERSLETAGASSADALAALTRFALPVVGEGGAGEDAAEVNAPPGPDFAYAEPPHPLFLTQARGAGSVVLNADADGVARRDRLVYRHRGNLYPSLALAAARVLEPERYGGPVGFEPGAVRFSGARVPVDAEGRTLLRFRGPFRRAEETTYPVYPAFRVLTSFEQIARGVDPDLPLATFQDKVVFVGVTAVGTTEFEVRPTPVAATDPGVMIHATALDNLLQGDFLRVAPTAASLGVLAGAGLGAGLLTAALGSAVLASLAMLLLMALLAGGTVLALSAGVWIELVAPALAGSLAFAGAMVANYVTEGREKRRVKDMFSRYVSPEYVNRLADDMESLELGGARTTISILFSDIRGFTSMSEKLPANEVIDVLNEYLDSMAEVVFRHGGTLDKFIGDAVMAFWGAPVPVEDHARRAVEAALEMNAELAALNRRWEERGAPAQLAIGIGINTGEAVVGNIGSLRRKLDYTAIGDAVNLASRLESLNKSYSTTLLVSQSTADAVADEYDLRLVESVTVKGKTQAVNVYEVMGRKRPANPPAASAGALSAGLLLAALLLPAHAGAQQAAKARWTDWVYSPGSWVSGQLRATRTTNQNTDSLALVAKVETYAAAPRWRIEIAKVTDGRTLAAPVVVVGGSAAPVVLTAVGSTPLAEHAAAADPVVQALVRGFGADGRVLRAPPARVVEMGDGGTVALVLVRRPVARAEFDDGLLNPGAAGRLGRSVGRFGVQSLAGERRTDVVASAGARGVARVQTVDGEIIVNPDTAAVRRMEQVDIDIIDMELFLRELSEGTEPLGAEPQPRQPKPEQYAKLEEVDL